MRRLRSFSATCIGSRREGGILAHFWANRNAEQTNANHNLAKEAK